MNFDKIKKCWDENLKYMGSEFITTVFCHSIWSWSLFHSIWRKTQIQLIYYKNMNIVLIFMKLNFRLKVTKRIEFEKKFLNKLIEIDRNLHNEN